MSTTTDPPRLRALGPALPVELARALEPAPDEEAPPEALARLEEALRDERSFAPPKRRASARSTFGLATTFALGAAAGVLVAGGVFVAGRVRAPHDAPPNGPVLARSGSVVERQAPAREPSDSVLVAPSARVETPPSAAPSMHARAPAPLESAPVAADRAEEVAILSRAQEALETDAGKALALTSDHERHFPHGVLAQEREVIAIDALVRLGRRAEAQARAAEFHRRYPSSVHGRRIDVLLGDVSFAPGDHN